MSLLSIEELSVEYRTHGQWWKVVDNVSLDVGYGETLGVVGESGCGKSTLFRAASLLLAKNGRVSSGRILYEGEDMLQMSSARLRAVRWSGISIVFQAAMNVLDPVYPISRQITEAIHAHVPGTSRRAAISRANEVLEAVGIPLSRASAYPHELSGGMKQRVGIAMAMVLRPKLVIADEPTTALDVITQDGVIAQLKKSQAEVGFSLVLISHDMGLIAETCDRVVVMYGGEIVEIGQTRQIFRDAAHPYTLGLLNSIPRADGAQVVSIPGQPPERVGEVIGCKFAVRCPFVIDECSAPPPWREVVPLHRSRCWRADQRQLLQLDAEKMATWDAVERRLEQRSSERV